MRQRRRALGRVTCPRDGQVGNEMLLCDSEGCAGADRRTASEWMKARPRGVFTRLAIVGRRVPPQVPRAAAGRGARGQLVLPKLRQRRRLRPVLCLPRHAEVRRRRLPEMTREITRDYSSTRRSSEAELASAAPRCPAVSPTHGEELERGGGVGSQVQGRARRDASASHAPRAPTCPAASHRAARRETARAAEARAAEARAAEARAAAAQAQARSHPRPSCPSRRRATCRTSGRGPRRRECEPWQAAALFFIVSLLVSSAFLSF